MKIAGAYDPEHGVLKLDGELVSCMEVVTRTPTTVTQTMRSDVNVDYAVYGELNDGTAVTIPSATRGACTHDVTETSQEFLFLWAMEGAHTSPETQYVAASVVYEGLSRATWSGALDISAVGRVALSSNAAVQFRPESGLAQEDFERHIINPFSVLMTWLAGSLVRPSAVRLTSASGEDVTVQRKAPTARAALPSHLWLEPADLAVKALAAWYRIWHALIPVPSVVAKVIAQSDLDIELRVLSLAASAEALHRELHDFKVMDRGEARAVRKAALAGVPPGAKERVTTLLAGLRDLTYAERLSDLANRLGPLGVEVAGDNAAAPDRVGRTPREIWIAAVKDARNGFAHQRRTSPESIHDYAGQMFTLYEALRWFMTGLLLMEMGYSSQEATKLLKRSSAYHLFRERAEHHWPEVYAAPATPRADPPR